MQGLQPYSRRPRRSTTRSAPRSTARMAPAFTLTARLPNGFFPVNDSAQARSAAARAGETPAVATGGRGKNNRYRGRSTVPAGTRAIETVTLTFDSWVGLTLGTFTTHVTATATPSSIATDGRAGHRAPESRGERSVDRDRDPVRTRSVAGHIAVQRRAGLLQGEARRPADGYSDLRLPQCALRTLTST